MLGMEPHIFWTLVIGVMTCCSCALVGCFLVLRNLSMMGDAISHSVLPGIVIAVLFSGSLSSLPIFLGAGFLGILTPFLIDLLNRSGRIYDDASLGAVFTVLFALGVVMITQMGNVHVDMDCVLTGEIAIAHLDTWYLGGVAMGPLPAWSQGTVFLINILFVTFCYKELKICSFDPQLAQSLGMRPVLVHYLLMSAVALTTIAAFKSVGVILVVGMLIAPASAAYLLSGRLSVMIGLSLVFGFLSAVLGYGLSVWGALPFEGVEGLSVSGSMTVVAGVIFTLSFLFSPQHGLIPKWFHRYRLSRKIERDNFLVYLYRAIRQDGAPVAPEELDIRHGDWSDRRKRSVGNRLAKNDLIRAVDERYDLTAQGTKKARSLLQSHRLWETFIHDIGLPEDHLHRTADEMEHYMDDDLREDLDNSLGRPEQDPHGKEIPRADRDDASPRDERDREQKP